MTPQQIADQKAQQPKPPIGLMPRDIWVSQRIDEIWKAIDRYTDADKSIPAIWMQELRDHQSPRDVLRVVQPDAVEQVAPVQDEPTGAELVGRKVWVSWSREGHWTLGGLKCVAFHESYSAPYEICDPGGRTQFWCYAKLYREGVTP